MTKLTDLTELTDIATNDFVHVVDVSDTSQNAAGSSKKVKITNLLTTSHGKMQIVATRGAIANNRITDASYNRMESRKKYFLGCQPVSQIRVAHAGIVLLGAGGGEVSINNDCSFEAGVEVDTPSASSIPIWTRGARILPLINGCPPTNTDAAGYDLPAGGYVFIRLSCTASATQYLPYSDRASASGDSVYFSAAAASQVPGTGSMTLPSGGASRTDGPSVAAVLGVPAAPMASVIILGDSIFDGVGDTGDASGNWGYAARGLWSVNGYPVPWVKQTVTGDLLSKNTLATGSRKRCLWPYATHLLCNLGWNDINTGATLATLQGYLMDIWRSAKRTVGPYGKPMHVTQALITPGTTSSDAFATAANQTHRTGFAPGGIRDQLNIWILSQVGQGLLDATINPNSSFEDTGNPGKWAVNGTANYATTDGIHPSAALHTNAAAVVNAWALGIRP